MRSAGVVSGVVVAQETIPRKVGDGVEEGLVPVHPATGDVLALDVAVETDEIGAAAVPERLRATVDESQIDGDISESLCLTAPSSYCVQPGGWDVKVWSRLVIMTP